MKKPKAMQGLGSGAVIGTRELELLVKIVYAFLLLTCASLCLKVKKFAEFQ